MVRGTVRDLAPILIERVTTPDQRRLFRELVGRYHYLGHTVLFGAHLRYLVVASQPARQGVGCVQFSSAAWRIAARDRWIGWTDQRRARQHLDLFLEAYNLTNHVNLSGANTNLISNSFLVRHHAGDPRQIQWGARYVF